jgi:DNA repair protein RadA/Sms
MVKNRSQFVCQQCGAMHSKWAGKCEQCGAWNSLVEELTQAQDGKSAVARSSGKALKPISLGESLKAPRLDRMKVSIGDIDEVLGGGIVPASVILLAGQPGIGKSTLLGQAAASLANADRKVLYVSGEESIEQVAGRMERLKADHGHIALVSSTNTDDIATTIRTSGYDVVIVDSIQTLVMTELSSAPGSVSQITNSANVLMQAAKASNTALILVGHVTKDGTIAGPKVLEHLVDVVLSLEGDRYGGFKVLRTVKNRYGSTAEAALFEMAQDGLMPVTNPSEALLSERQNADGSVILATLEGNRPLLVEIQALVSPTSFGYPKRTASGFDLNRLQVLIAVVEQRTKLKLSDQDIFINVVGGLKLADPGADLAVCMAIASAAAKRQLSETTVVFGEVGLSGEIRSASSAAKRIAEAKKLGFKHAIAPPSAGQAPFIQAETRLREALNSHLEVKK